MRYLILIHLDEEKMGAMTQREVNDLNARHITLNDKLRKSGQLVEAEALAPSSATRQLRTRSGKSSVVDGPYAEAKEMIAGVYLVEARDDDEAMEIARQIPCGTHGSIEVRPSRRFVVDGVAH